jgi:anaerobic magnesium-protoporphyrin IX monomethyl ester cyclase
MKTSWRTIVAAHNGDAGHLPKKRILLISVECTEASARTPMLASTYLVAHARTDPAVKAGVEFHIRQFCILEPIEVMVEEILRHQYDAIGFSCYVWNYHVHEQIIPVLHRLLPEAVLIMGGPQTLDQEADLLRRIPELDIIVTRDGEAAFLEITRAVLAGQKDWSNIGGLVYRAGEQICDTRGNRKIVKFHQIASPYIDGIITGKHDNLFMETYRGCPYTCAFCAWGGGDVPMNDLLPLDRIEQELALIHSMGAFSIGFFDANFNQPPPRAKIIYDMILERPEFAIMGMSIFAQTLTQELAESISKRATLIGVGLQSSDPNVNSIMKRRYRDEKMMTGLRLLNQYNIKYSLQVIIGLPGDTYDTIAETLKYALSFNPPSIDAFRLMVLPGTEYKKRADELKMVYELRPYHYVISTYSMPPEEINRAERMGQTLNLFYNLPETRKEMFRQAEENGESVIDLCAAAGRFIEDFNLFNRDELRKGDLLRSHDETYLLKVMQDFRRFRHDLAQEMEAQRLCMKEERSTAPYGFSYSESH